MAGKLNREYRVWYGGQFGPACFTVRARSREEVRIPEYAKKTLIEVEELDSEEGEVTP